MKSGVGMTTSSESLEIGEIVYRSNHQNVFCLVHFNDMDVRGSSAQHLSVSC